MCRKDLLLRVKQDVILGPYSVHKIEYKLDGFQPKIHFEPVI